MRFLLSSALKDLKRRIADPTSLLIWIAVPALLGMLVSFLNAGGATPAAHVLIANQDESVVTTLLLGGLQQEAISEVVTTENVDLAAGRERIGDGDATALLIIPDGFGEALLTDEPVELELITNPAERILPETVIAGLEAFSELVFYGQQIIGDELQPLGEGPESGSEFFESAAIAGMAAAINDRMIELDQLLASPWFEFDADEDVAEVGAAALAGFDLAAFILPGVLFMSVLFIAQGLSEDFWTEKAAGTLRRALTAPQSLALFVGGKLLSGLALMLIVAIIALTTGVLVFDVPPGRAAGAVVWSAYAGTALLCLFLFIATLCTSQRAASMTTMFFLFPLMMIGGSFLPFEVMPDWMAAIGSRTPNGIAVIQLREMLFGSLSLTSLVGAAAAIGGVTVITLLLSVRRLQVFAAT